MCWRKESLSFLYKYAVRINNDCLNKFPLLKPVRSFRNKEDEPYPHLHMCIDSKWICNPLEVTGNIQALLNNHVCNCSKDWRQCFKTGLNLILHKLEILWQSQQRVFLYYFINFDRPKQELMWICSIWEFCLVFFNFNFLSYFCCTICRWHQ